MAEAAVIAAVSNALGNAPYPFVFGGDGASFALPSDRAAAARQALACTAAFVVEVYGLELRVAEVPVAALTFGSPALPPLATSTKRCFLAAASPGPRRG
jgi:hypothetical protein